MSELHAMFKAYDIRGKVGPELNPDTVTSIGRAFADWLPAEGPVAVGYDMRPDSKALADAMIDGLRRQGRDVISIGRVTSDMIYFVVGDQELAGGAMITASHNPGEYNGIKLCRERAGAVGLDTGLSVIRDRVLEPDFDDSHEQGTLTHTDVMDDWIAHVLSFIDPSTLDGLKIAVDAGNGMAGAVMPHLNDATAMDIGELYWELDGTFPNHEANPIKLETLADLQAKVKAEGLDLGFAFDGDGDRVGVIDDEGEIVPPSVIVAMLAKKFLADKPGSTILHNLICSKVVLETIEANGGTPVRTKVGHSHIKADMKAHNGLFGGEHSAHYFFADNYNADSGLVAAIIVLEVVATADQPLSVLRKEYERYLAIPEINYEVADKTAMLQTIKDTFVELGTVDDLDGVTVDMGTRWFNVRPSNTEPLLRLNAEAEDQVALDELVEQVQAVLSS